MLKGYYVEMKDPKNAEKTEDQIKAIVVKNLEKDPLFYVKDGEFGIRGVGYSSEHPGLPKDIYGNYALGIEPKVKLTGKYKSSGMEPVNLNEAKKRTIEKHIAEIEKMGEVAAWGHRIGKIQEKIDELTNKMTVTEGDDVKDMVDKKAVKELKKDIALLTKKKALYEKQKTKAAGRVKDKSAMQTAAGEGTTVMEKEEKPFTPPTDPDRERAFASMKRDTAPKPKKESWSGMVRELINTKNLKVK
jgi:ribosomal protein S19E (S16A)